MGSCFTTFIFLWKKQTYPRVLLREIQASTVQRIKHQNNDRHELSKIYTQLVLNRETLPVKGQARMMMFLSYGITFSESNFSVFLYQRYCSSFLIIR